MKYTLGEVASIIDAQLIGNPDVVVNYVITDSRSVSFPETTLFVALKTSKNDGHRYISSSRLRGSTVFWSARSRLMTLRIISSSSPLLFRPSNALQHTTGHYSISP